MISASTKQLAHVIWIGGATDSGKSTIARNLAQQYGLNVYHYDKVDSEQIEKLAKTTPEIHHYINSSLEERWINQTPQMMFDFLLMAFKHRFQLVLESLLEMPRNKPIIVEGFGLLPEFVAPWLSNRNQAIWLVPTEHFKWESMRIRGKPSFASLLSNPELARRNLFARDMMLGDYYRKQVCKFNFTLFVIDGIQTIEEVTKKVRLHFAEYLPVFLQ